MNYKTRDDKESFLSYMNSNIKKKTKHVSKYNQTQHEMLIMNIMIERQRSDKIQS